MSRIFEALQKEQGETSNTVIAALEETVADCAQSAPAPMLIAHSLDMAAAELKHAARISCVNMHVSEEPPAPAVVEIPKLVSKPSESVNLRPLARTVPLKVFTNSPLLPFDTANWRASEQYRTIRTKIIQDPRQPQMVLISSAGSGDGKSVTAINIAGALSLKAESDVLLVDGDFRRSSLHTQLSLPPSPGVTDILLNQCALDDAVVRAEQFPNFYILPTGTRRDNPSDLLESSAWVNLQARLREKFRYIIVDCPPIGAVSEYDLLQLACDGVIVIARPDHTKLDEFLKSVQSVPLHKMIGVVVNCVSDWFLARPFSSYDYSRPRK